MANETIIISKDCTVELKDDVFVVINELTGERKEYKLSGLPEQTRNKNPYCEKLINKLPHDLITGMPHCQVEDKDGNSN